MSTFYPRYEPNEWAPLSRAIRAGAPIVLGQTAALAAITIAVATVISLALDSALPARSLPSLIGLALFCWALIGAACLLTNTRNQIIGRCIAMIASDAPSDNSDPALLFNEQSPTAGAIAVANSTQLPWLLLAATIIQPMLGILLLAFSIMMLIAVYWRAKYKPGTAAAAKDNGTIPDQMQVVHSGLEAVALGIPTRWQEHWREDTRALIEGARQCEARRRAHDLAAIVLAMTALVVVGCAVAFSMVEGEATIGSAASIFLLSAVSLLICTKMWFVARILPRLGILLRRRRADRSRNTQGNLATVSLPAPTRQVSVESLSLSYDVKERPALRNLSCHLVAGSVTTVMGPGGSGKSSLLRAMTGAWPLSGGEIRLDDADVRHYSPAQLARHIGYLAQNPEIFAGTIAANIAGFDLSVSDDAIVAAAKQAGIHEAILRLGAGYSQNVGTHASGLSASLHQGIALARALIRQPMLLLLDEPFAHLDPAGAQAVESVIEAARRRSAVVVIGSNDQRVVDLADQLLIMRGGTCLDFGPKLDVWGRARANQAAVQYGKLSRRADGCKPNIAAGKAA